MQEGTEDEFKEAFKYNSKFHQSKTSGISGVPIYQVSKQNNMNFTGFDKQRLSDQVELIDSDARRPDFSETFPATGK